ncbi:MAG: hypothetical protein ABI345_02855 [Jatrophihabitans sp.]
MAIELPGIVADFLGFIGINWPNVNEDHVREFGQHVADFATQLENTHRSGTDTVQQVGQAYQGESYQQLFATWGQMSETHMTALIDACHVLSTGLDIGADVIVGEKIAALTQLAILAAEFIADQAAAVATFGLAEAGMALIEEQGQLVIKFLEQEIENYIEGKIFEAAAGPLIEKVSEVVSGMVYQGTAAALGQHAGGSNADAPPLNIEPDQVLGLAKKLHEHGDEAESHGTEFHGRISVLTFSE